MNKNLIIILSFIVLTLSSCRKTEVYYDFFGRVSSEIEMKRGVPDGTSTFYFQDGNNIKLKSHYKNGELNGPTTRWYYNGLKEAEEYYKNNLLDGVRKEWDKNGHLIIEEEYVAGNLDGVSKKWYSNGQIQIDAYYLNGLPHGKWTYYDFNGVEVGYAEFEKGNGSQISLNPNGTIDKVIHYENGIKINEE
ncbi:toxin-antitoxin system YwqK family antitoxin [Bacteroidales bacterium OttesenSCG-928-K03]|nr:toxin-antitoxin system YwqK family antitoxin [Odoribacter sp. OttesenSCG-928-L07]MDL2238644.1 toxin-antitoxin system YwqK family antitoxin [Bacteroidales bacterium OttesenSCG-928-L14]MDL2240279.1 toxin-antitoxin system YwqK family antitoxin [Bacteroidales bacterium OttesenSCG-928-K22]MDL2242704.1 toxin-antitoxin system YwqK family antitoxin [Bacteroidales bacterium OttesenSCG-928-K03]